MMEKPLSWYRETYIKDGYRCVYCGRDMLDDFESWMSLEIDHIIPKSKGGGDSIDNLVASCNVCNRLKSTFVPEGYEEMQKEELLRQIRANILEKRAKWLAEFYPAIEEYREVQARRDTS